MLFLFYWAVPVHREPLWIEIMFNGFLIWITELFSAPFRGTVLEWWLLHPEGRILTQLFTIILAVLIWYFALDGSLWRTARAFRTKLTNIEAVIEEPESMNSVGDTPIMRKLAPPVHQPTNAHLGDSPFRVHNPLGGRAGRFSTPQQTSPTTPKTSNSESSASDGGSSSSAQLNSKHMHALFGFEKENGFGRGRQTSKTGGLGGRTGRPSSPGHQTPFKTRNTINTLDQKSQKSLLRTRENFNQNLGIRPEGAQAIGTPASQHPDAIQSSPGFTSFMSEAEKIKAYVDRTMADLDKMTNGPKKLDPNSSVAIDRSRIAKRKTLREHYYPQSVEHPHKFPSSSNFPVPSDEEWGDELVDF